MRGNLFWNVTTGLFGAIYSKNGREISGNTFVDCHNNNPLYAAFVYVSPHANLTAEVHNNIFTEGTGASAQRCERDRSGRP